MITTSNEIAKIGLAMAKIQGAINGALKSTKNEFFKSSYADLESVIEAFREEAAKNEIAYIQGSDIDGELVGVTTLLVHSSGEWIRTRVASRPKDLGCQSVGSAISYNRRYGIAAAFGVYQTDDDAEAAQGRTKKAPAEVSAELKALLEDAAMRGLITFRAAWKALPKDRRAEAQSDAKWFDGLRATAEANAQSGA